MLLLNCAAVAILAMVVALPIHLTDGLREDAVLNPNVALSHCLWIDKGFLLEWQLSLIPKNTLEFRFTVDTQREKFSAAGFTYYDKTEIVTGFPVENVACARSLYDTWSSYDINGDIYPNFPEVPGKIVFANDTHATHYLMRNLSVAARTMLQQGGTLPTNITIMWGFMQRSLFNGGCYMSNIVPHTEYATIKILLAGSTYARLPGGGCNLYLGRRTSHRMFKPISKDGPVPLLDREQNQNRRVATLLIGGDLLLDSGRYPPVFASTGRVYGGENGNGACQQSLTRLYARWKGFSDKVGGIKKYLVSLGTSELPSLYVDRYDAGTMQAMEYAPSPSLKKNTSLIVTVSAYNYAGLSTTIVSKPVKVLNNGNPLRGWLYDGVSSGAVDIDYQYSSTTLNAFWGGWRREEHSLINPDTGVITEKGVQYAVGVQGQAVNGVKDWTVISSTVWNTEVAITGLSLTPGVTYTVSIRAISCASVYTMQTSDGVTIDQAPPRPGTVLFGNGTRHLSKVKLSQRLQAIWSGFTDLHSGVAKYMWAMGLSAHAQDVTGNTGNTFPWTDVGLNRNPSGPRLQSFSGFTVGTAFYIYVKAIDGVGNFVVTASNQTTIIGN